MSLPIDFIVPSQWQMAHNLGQVVRYGAILKDSQTGQIVAHLQETGALQKGLDIATNLGASSANPLAAVTGAVGAVQNHFISKKLDHLHHMMSGVQTLGIANLAVTGIGIGVTVASTVIMMKRLENLSKQIESDLAEVTEARRRDEVDRWRANVRSELQDLDELRVRGDVRHAAEQVARGTRRLSDEISERLRRVQDRSGLDVGTVTELITFLATLSGAQIRALCWLDEAEAAQHRAMTICNNFEDLSLAMPADQIPGPASFGPKVQAMLSEVRAAAACQPMLLNTLNAREVSPRAYLDAVELEEDEPLLLLPVGSH